MKQWFIVYTKPKREALAGENLRRQGYEFYCPLIQEKRCCRGAWCKITEPLFPRYLFINLEQGQDNFAPIRSTIGVIDFVRFGGTPKPVPQKLIAEIKAREELKLGMVVRSIQWESGAEVEFIEGPFVGFRGIFNASCGKERVSILLRLLGNENLVVVAENTIVPG